MKSFLAALLLLAGSVTAFAQVPSLMSYQGHVSDASGTAIGNSTPVNRLITFKFYTVSSGGTPVYAEAQTVTISGGDFSVLLGNGTGVSGLAGPSAPANTPFITLSSIFTTTLYLGVTVDDGTAAADPEISPRQQIVAAGFAFRAKVAETVADSALTTAMLADTAVSTNKIGAAQVTTAKIANSNITTALLADGNITTAKIANLAVTTALIADNAVTNGKIADGSITPTKLAANSVGSVTIADNTITTADIADGTIATADLADSAVTNGKVANNAIDYNKLAAAIQQSICPPGTITAYAGDTAPAGWQLCDGTSLNRTTYASLYNVVGTRFGAPDGSSFRVPDLRGRFLRGRDFGVGNDPDRASRTTMNSGGATGDAVGSVQDDMFKSHVHDLPRDTGGHHSIQTVTDTSNSDEDISSLSQTGATGGNETRPKNAYVNFIIKL